MNDSESAVQWSLDSWAKRHDEGYFPNSDQHKDWKVYNAVPDWLVGAIKMHKKDACLIEALEVGCGYGEWMIPLSSSVSNVSGFDIHESVVSKGNELIRERGIKNASITKNDGLTIPYQDKSFDFVYSISVFQHLPRSIVSGYLRETRRVIRDDGVVAHHFRNAENVGPYPPLATDITFDHKGDFSVGWTAEQVKSAGESSGFDAHVVDIGLFLVMVGTPK